MIEVAADPRLAGWLLSCGHRAAMTSVELERAAAGTLEAPQRPRMCPVCQKPREVETTRKEGPDHS